MPHIYVTRKNRLLIYTKYYIAHDIPEIRIRSLKSIESKFILGTRHNENITVNAALLMKWLLRWFGLVQCDESDRVLGLILLILKVPMRYYKDIFRNHILQKYISVPCLE